MVIIITARCWMLINTNVVGIKSINGIHTDSPENRIYNDNKDINYKFKKILKKCTY